MLWLYNLQKERIRPIIEINSGEIESVLETGEKTLTVELPSLYADSIQEEWYLRNKTTEFVIKKVERVNTLISIEAKINLEELESILIEPKIYEGTVFTIINQFIAGTGYTLLECNVVDSISYEVKEKCTPLDALKGLFGEFLLEPTYYTLEKKIAVYDCKGVDRGVFFMDRLNLIEMKVQGDSYEYKTRVYPEGKDGLKIGTVNNGLEYLEDFRYTNKVLPFLFKDEECTNPQKLKELAKAKLEEVCYPYRAYEATIVDLAKVAEKYEKYAFELGDTITLVSKATNVREKQRVSVYKENLVNPVDNTVELCNKKLRLEDLLKERSKK